MNQMTARPTAASSRPLAQCQTIGEALQTTEFAQRLAKCVPAHLNPERMLRVLTLAISKVPELARAPLRELLGAMFTLSSLGLEPNTPLGLAHLIPYKTRVKNPETNRWEDGYTVQVIIGYRGYIDLARRTGTLVSIHADVVYEGDFFEFEYGSNMHLRHRPGPVREGTPIYAYAHVKLKDGEAFEVLPYGEVLKIRDNSEGYKYALSVKDAAESWKQKAWLTNPWVRFEHEMSAKTMVRRVSKMVPMSVEFMTAATIDAASEGGQRMRWDAAINVTAKTLDSQNLQVDDEIAQIEDKQEAPLQTTVDQRQPETVTVRAQPAQADRRVEQADQRSAPTAAEEGDMPLIEPRPDSRKPGEYDLAEWQARFLRVVGTIQDPSDLATLQKAHEHILVALKRADIGIYDKVITGLREAAAKLLGNGGEKAE